MINVVRRQLLAVISNPEKMPADVQKFKTMVFSNTYEDIKLQEVQASDERVQDQLKSDALVDIKSEKRDAMVEVVREQRLHFMCSGAWFHPIIKVGTPLSTVPPHCAPSALPSYSPERVTWYTPRSRP